MVAPPAVTARPPAVMVAPPADTVRPPCVTTTPPDETEPRVMAPVPMALMVSALLLAGVLASITVSATPPLGPADVTCRPVTEPAGFAFTPRAGSVAPWRPTVRADAEFDVR